MKVQATNPWNGELEEATACWACGKDFADQDEVLVVDAASPKVVHKDCRNQMVPETEGGPQ